MVILIYYLRFGLNIIIKNINIKINNTFIII